VEKAEDNMCSLLSEVEGIKERILRVGRSLKNKIYDEVYMLNKTARAKELQYKFLTNKKIKRKDLYHLIH
jgi:hypothetical protein